MHKYTQKAGKSRHFAIKFSNQAKIPAQRISYKVFFQRNKVYLPEK